MRNILMLSLAMIAACGTTIAGAQWVQWSGNGHYYAVMLITGNDHSWSTARAQAQALAPLSFSDLATLTSQEENDFVFNLANDPSFWRIDGAGNNEGPYLGGFQPAGAPEPAGGWTWVTGEPWQYSAWAPGEPNNVGGSENFLTFFSQGSQRLANWNDVGDSPEAVQVAYVAEAVPEPASFAALGLGLLALIRKSKRN